MNLEIRTFLMNHQAELSRKCALIYDGIFGTNTHCAIGCRIQVLGTLYLNRYDERPDWGVFHQDGVREYPVAPFTAYHDLRIRAEEHFSLLLGENGQCDTEPYDGLFVPSSIRILNADGGVIDLYELGQWLEKHIPVELWLETELQIAALERHAIDEMRGDNFDSARQARRQADALAARLSVSKHASGLKGFSSGTKTAM